MPKRSQARGHAAMVVCRNGLCDEPSGVCTCKHGWLLPDCAAYSLVALGGGVTTELGASARFGAAVLVEPQQEIRCSLESSDPSEGVPANTELVLRAKGRFEFAHIVGVKDYDEDGDVDYQIRIVRCEAVILSTGTPIPAQCSCRQRCRDA